MPTWSLNIVHQYHRKQICFMLAVTCHYDLQLSPQFKIPEEPGRSHHVWTYYSLQSIATVHYHSYFTIFGLTRPGFERRHPM